MHGRKWYFDGENWFKDSTDVEVPNGSVTNNSGLCPTNQNLTKLIFKMGLRTILFLINKHAKIYIIDGVKKFFNVDNVLYSHYLVFIIKQLTIIERKITSYQVLHIFD